MEDKEMDIKFSSDKGSRCICEKKNKEDAKD
jgi:hypothetical protein